MPSVYQPMEGLIGIIASIATVIAAVMTAANLGARVTGWGFVIFTIASLAWCAVAFASGQQNLLLTNGFLALVSLIGIWRWLGRVARHDEGALAAEAKSEVSLAPTLVAVSNMVGRKVVCPGGATAGTIIGIMAERGSGKIAFGVVGIGGVGGLGERLIAVDWRDLKVEGEDMKTTLNERQIAERPTVDPEDWPIAAN